MKQRILNNQVSLLAVIFISLFTSVHTFGQLVLTDEAIPVKPKEFYIADITVEKSNRSSIGQLITVGVSNKTTYKPIGLKEGTDIEIGRFIKRNLPANQSLRPVIISIKELILKETILTDGRVDGHIQLLSSFGLKKDYGTDHLLDFKGGLHYIRSAGNTTSIESYLRSILKTSLVYFDNWINNNADINRKLAKEVKISFTDYIEKPEGDTIYYSPSRPLTWDDFQSKNRPTGIFEAQVIPGIGYNQQEEISKGTIHVHIAMKAYLPKSASRANYGGKDNYTLNHEQRHFDIVKIITEHFKQKILTKELTPDTYEAFISIQYLEANRDMHAMQTAYDKETNHGINRYAQQLWNKRIDEALNK